MNNQEILPIFCKHHEFLYPGENGDDVLVGVCKLCGARQESISARGLTHLYTKQRREYNIRGAEHMKHLVASMIYEDDKEKSGNL